MVCKSKFTFNFNINKINKDIRRQDKHTSSEIKKGMFVIKEKGKKNIKAYPNNWNTEPDVIRGSDVKSRVHQYASF